MKVVILNCFDTYEDRVLLLQSYFLKRGAGVRVVTSDYCHFKKEYRTDFPKGFIPVHARKYEKNISPARVMSHEEFAKDALKTVGRLKPDVLWVLAPPNSLVKKAALYKKKRPEVKLIIDMIDMWPETMPMDSMKFLPPFQMWKNLRDGYIKKADLVVTECELYRKVLKNKCDAEKIRTLYLAKRDVVLKSVSAEESTGVLTADGTEGGKRKPDEYAYPPSDRWSLCYLGSINNIIDIDCIADIISKLPGLKEKPILHIIGDGERKDSLIGAANQAGAEVIYHGKIYDEAEKRKIFDTCHFGLNIMKKDVFVGLTMKSIDYFANGLPIINNIPGDTKHLVSKYQIGVNFDGDFLLEEPVYKASYRSNVRKLFDEKFTPESFEKRLDMILSKVIEIGE